MPESASRGGGGCLLWGICSLGGVCSGGVSWGVSAPGGGGLLWGGVCSGGSAPGGSAAGGVCARGVFAPGGSAPVGCVSQDALWTESQTPVKTLPWPNFVAAGKDVITVAHATLFAFHLVVLL